MGKKSDKWKGRYRHLAFMVHVADGWAVQYHEVKTTLAESEARVDLLEDANSTWKDKCLALEEEAERVSELLQAREDAAVVADIRREAEEGASDEQ